MIAPPFELPDNLRAPGAIASATIAFTPPDTMLGRRRGPNSDAPVLRLTGLYI
jgi:hypothetical protein